MRYLILALFGVVCGSAHARSVSDDIYRARLQMQRTIYPQEKIYVHTDKDHYVAGDTIRFRAHVVDASTHLPVRASKYVYAELRNLTASSAGGEEPVPVRVRVLEREGIYAGYFPLPITTASGDYQLTAYTAFLCNPGPGYFFRKNIRVEAYGSPYVRSKERSGAGRNYDVSFYPEGGYLVAGIRCRVGVKALRPDGNSLAVTGRIVDDRGAECATFTTLHAGMGQVFFTPASGRSYMAECRNDAGAVRRFRLPEVRSDARILQVHPASERFAVNAAGPDRDGLRLVIQNRGALCAAVPLTGTASFFRSEFPEGILHLLLVDADDRVLSERLLFNDVRDGRPRISVAADKSGYDRREKVCLTARIEDREGNPVRGTLSVSVTDNRMVDPYRCQDVRTALLLTSELRGWVEDPAWYFEAGRTSERCTALDALLLTQGWRRYDIASVLAGRYAEPEEPLEIGQEISGRIRKTGLFRKRNFRNYRVSALAPSQHYFASAAVDSSGRFSLNGFDFPEGTTVVLRAAADDGREDVELLIDEEAGRPEGIERLPIPDARDLTERYNLHYGRFTDSLNHILLEAIAIETRRPEPIENPYQVLSRTSIGSDEIEKNGFNSIEEILRSRHGISFFRNKIRAYGTEARFMVDGVFEETMDDMDADARNLLVPADDSHAPLRRNLPVIESNDPCAAVSHLPVDMIERIDIIPPFCTNLFNRNCSVISITTKSGRELLQSMRPDAPLNLKVVTPVGYQKPVEFYAPVYGTARQRSVRDRDLRTTLYWNPALEIAPDGTVRIEFYTSDEAGDFHVDIEGVGTVGDRAVIVKN